jgi:hypothetical protein
MEYLKIILSVLLLIQPIAAKIESEAFLPANTEYAGYFDFDFDKTPESYYYADGTFYVHNDKGEEIGSFEPKYPKIYDISATDYEERGETTVAFGSDRAVFQYLLRITDGKLEIAEEEDYPYEDMDYRLVSAAKALPEGMQKIAFYFGEAVMSTPAEYKNGASKARYDYFQTETYRQEFALLFANTVEGNSHMVCYQGDHKFSLNGEEFELKSLGENWYSTVYRMEECLIFKDAASSNSNPVVARFTKEGFEAAEVSELGTMIEKPDPDINEYLIENDYYGGGVNDYKPNIHIYQKYFVYKNENGEFCEYGGLEVPIKDFLEIDGAWDFVVRNFSDDKNYLLLYNVLYRENNTISVNVIEMFGKEYSEEWDLKYGGKKMSFLFRYENGILEYLDGGEGWYDKSYFENHMEVTYPESLPLFDADENEINLYVD